MADTVEIKTKVSFRAWPVPDSASLDVPPGLKQEGMKPVPTFPLTELDDEVVDALAQRWLDNLYANRAQDAPFTYRKRAQAV
jgi:hypothetical protein